MQEIRHCRTASGSEQMLALNQLPPVYQQRMQSDHEFSDERIPLGYHITFRSYGTWLHGTAGSVDRFHNVYGEPRLIANEKRKQYNQRLLKQPPVRFNPKQRAVVLSAITETCEIRKWDLWASNIRSNHVHAVVTANCKPKRILNAFKANATRQLRAVNYWRADPGPWARGGSRRYLWTEESLSDAVAYVLYEQGD
jgi:REP element-mobilizing transposase RayT